MRHVFLHISFRVWRSLLLLALASLMTGCGGKKSGTDDGAAATDDGVGGTLGGGKF